MSTSGSVAVAGEGSRTDGGGSTTVAERGGHPDNIGGTISTTKDDATGLVKDHVDLLKAEVGDLAGDAKKAGTGIGLLVAALPPLLLFVVFGSLFVAEWLNGTPLDNYKGFGIVATVFLLLALVLALVGQKMVKALQGTKPPKRTIDSLKESVAVVKARVSSS